MDYGQKIKHHGEGAKKGMLLEKRNDCIANGDDNTEAMRSVDGNMTNTFEKSGFERKLQRYLKVSFCLASDINIHNIIYTYQSDRLRFPLAPQGLGLPQGIFSTIS